MSANHVHLINPATIHVAEVVNVESVYSILSISPLLIDNDDLVTVSFNTTTPAEDDWIGAYSPPTANILTSSPVKFGYCGALSKSTYLQDGFGHLAFNLTNLRAGVKFYYFKGGTDSPVLVANSTDVVEYNNVNQPLRNRVVATGDPNIFSLLWSSNNSVQPVLKWGLQSNSYIYTIPAITSHLEKSSMCGGVATGFGWRDLGAIHTANFTGLLDLNLSNKNISYIFGDAATNDFSKEFTLLVPPQAGTQPPNRPTTVALFADLGVGSSDNSYDTTGKISSLYEKFI